MLAFLASIIVLAISLVFLGGAMAGESFRLGLLLTGSGGGLLGIVYGSLIEIASNHEPSHD
jgi:hypothetical protein